MPTEIGLWRVDGSEAVKVTSSGVPLESRLEHLIEGDPTILGTPLLLIGRQVPTTYGTFIDLLAIDADGALHILELKRDRTPREVIAQVLDYGSWVQALTHEQVLGLFAAYKPDMAFEQAWTDCFGGSPPEELNGAHRLTVVASDIDVATERIVGYLASFDVPVNVVFFRYFDDGDRAYLARTWLLDETRTSPQPGRSGRRGSKEVWNGTDWYVSFGEESGNRNWDDARRYGFVSAGGGVWFSKTLRSLPEGARVFVCIPKTGYVGVGYVIGPAQQFDDAVVTVDGVARGLASLELRGSYHHSQGVEGEDTAEYVVPVRWEHTRPREQAVWQRGMFANQNSACKLRNRFTRDALAAAFGLEDKE
jgi:Endonuclease NucS